ncbi:ribulose-phosphate 3-epimerase [bacterium BMS3Abin05]|nr:ribulose-phosphate 3-epimerase [bacterium BMS3Abin05]GBE26265.1 ribulose-phosphate 3-epimerase [bacterium BMS3Bbin03]
MNFKRRRKTLLPKTIKLAASILSADFAHLAEEINLVEKAGVDFIHLDVMDGHFVPNITFGPAVIKKIRSVTDLPLDAHLMISEPNRYLEDFRRAGVDILTVHQEVCPHLHRTVQKIKRLGMKAGVALNPATPLVTVEEILTDIDLLLIMTVNPGFGGQTFIETMLSKIERAKQMIRKLDRTVEIEVDGGIDGLTAEETTRAGATILVSGSAIFHANDISESVKDILKKMKSESKRD